MSRYHPALVALHWAMALLILMGLFFGKFILAAMDNTDPEKAQGLGGHMTVGLIVGALLVIRLIVRFTSQKPPHAQTGNAILDRIGAATHWVLYILVALMVLSGLGTAFGGGLFPIAFGGSDEAIPGNLTELVPRIAHGMVSNLLILLLFLHIAAAFYHQLFLRDGLFARMWFGKRKIEETSQ